MKVYLSLLRDGGRERDGMTPFPTMRSDGSHTTSPSFGLYDDEMTYGQVDEASHST